MSDLAVDMRVITRPIDKGERISKGVIVALGPMRSRVQVAGVDKPLGFWNFELVPDLSQHA